MFLFSYVKEILFSAPDEYTLPPQLFQRGIQPFAWN